MAKDTTLPAHNSGVVRKRTSDLLKEIIHLPDEGTITISRFFAMLGDRSFALFILIFSLPNSLPVPGIPGFSTITGLPILLIALQVTFGQKNIWLPNKVAQTSFSHQVVSKILLKALPMIMWLERFIKPRVVFLCEGFGERFIGFMILIMASILVLPIVGGNFLPGFSISLMALALLENDGLFAIFSVLVTITSLVVMIEIIYFVFEAAANWILSII